jgi:hypothetical protein
VVTKLAKTDLIKGAVLLHPSWVTLDDINGMPLNFKFRFYRCKTMNFVLIYKMLLENN